MDLGLSGKSTIITGGSGGIGRGSFTASPKGERTLSSRRGTARRARKSPTRPRTCPAR